MARRPRVVLAGVPHHVTQRGNNRQTVFHDREDFGRYLELLAGYQAASGVRILAYCLMTNHVHLVAVPDGANGLARLLQRVHSEYALAANLRSGRNGHLWQNRFYSCPMDGTHLIRAMHYVESNPVRAGIVDAAWSWPWSSARAHVLEHVQDPVVAADWKDDWGGRWDFVEWREMLAAGAEGECDWQAVRVATQTGAPLGSERFVGELERRVGRRLRVRKRGRPQKVAGKGV
jgi:putative transposase